MGSRVWVYSAAAGETIGLAMSRSIGDWEWGDVGVIPEPLVDIVDLKDVPNAKKIFVLAASDGMWDTRLRPNFFAEYMASIYDGEGGHSALRQCYDLIRKISPKRDTVYRDDITMVAMEIG
uniref:PPM-type phosphatase domain-containing protein n=1 Tax=Cyclophora tenuis TaxID=216820 RepID=A0A7S1GLU4_CYCTE|mmetsp:Transcript_20908/g.35646  ORF Transcript_20908/g.35646 Transcript_20908/m.35646 type:complete len:121 (+) Transcript_20908:2-364(+)